MKEGLNPRLLRVLSGYSLLVCGAGGLWFAYEDWTWPALGGGVLIGLCLSLFNQAVQMDVTRGGAVR